MGDVFDDALAQAKRGVEDGFDPHRMTDIEMAAVTAYTGPGVGSWTYAELNHLLRTAARGGAAVPAQYDDWRRTVSDALAKLPDYPARNLKRMVTLSPEEVGRYVPGRVVTETGFTSTSYRPSKIEGIAFTGNVRFVIHGRHGKRIDGISEIPGEREVLFDAGTRFRVLRRRDKSGVTEITMEEAEDG